MDVNQTSYVDRFAIYTNIKPLYCISETNIILYVNDGSIFKNEQKINKNKKE